MRRKIYSTSDCKGYWYHARHGIGPGTIPNDVHLIKVVDDPENRWKDYICLDRFLTTQELRDYDLKEECPPQITASTNVLLPDVPEIEYYNRMDPEEEKYAFSFIDDQSLEDMGYGGYHILGWYTIQPEIDDILNGAGEYADVMLIDDGDHQFLGYIVGNRLYEIEKDEIGRYIRHAND